MAIFGAKILWELQLYANDGSYNTYAIDTSVDIISARAAAPGYGFMAVSSDGTKLYVPCPANSVDVVNTATNNVDATITVGNVPNAVAITPDGNQLLVTNWSDSTVSLISTASNSVSSTFSVDTNPWQIAISRDSKIAYIANLTGGSASALDLYPGAGNSSQFVYDPLGRCVKMIETVSGSVTSSVQHLWCGNQRCELRDSSGGFDYGKQYFGLGQVNFNSTGSSSTKYFYTKDHLGSIREMGHMSSGSYVLDSQFSYDPYGQATQIAGSGATPDFQFAGYYFHSPSGLSLTATRAYNPSIGRFISRDSIGEAGGLNLYAYCNNNPILLADPLGLCTDNLLAQSGPPGPTPSQSNIQSNMDNKPNQNQPQFPLMQFPPSDPGSNSGNSSNSGDDAVNKAMKSYQQQMPAWVGQQFGTVLPSGSGTGFTDTQGNFYTIDSTRDHLSSMRDVWGNVTIYSADGTPWKTVTAQDYKNDPRTYLTLPPLLIKY